MPRFNETSVVIHDCTIVWDGLNRPEQTKDGTPKYVLKAVIAPNNPDLAEFNQIAQEKLQQSQFNGVLPQGGRMPVGLAGPQEFGGLFPGFGVISAKTMYMPAVHAEDVSILDPMQWAGQIFPGQRVNLLVDCYEYNNAGNKGIGTGMQGVQILASAGAQRLALGGAGADTGAAFGGQPASVQPAAGPYAPPGTPPGPAVGPPMQQQPYVAPVQPTAAPAPYVAPVAVPVQPGPATSGYAQPAPAPVQQPYVQPAPATPGYPQQATNFIPSQQ